MNSTRVLSPSRQTERRVKLTLKNAGPTGDHVTPAGYKFFAYRSALQSTGPLFYPVILSTLKVFRNVISFLLGYEVTGIHRAGSNA